MEQVIDKCEKATDKQKSSILSIGNNGDSPLDMFFTLSITIIQLFIIIFF